MRGQMTWFHWHDGRVAGVYYPNGNRRISFVLTLTEPWRRKPKESLACFATRKVRAPLRTSLPTPRTNCRCRLEATWRTGRMVALAESLIDSFKSLDIAPMPPTSQYVVNVLRQSEVSNELAWDFVVRLCQKHLLAGLSSVWITMRTVKAIQKVCLHCHNKSRFLFDLLEPAP